MKRVLSTLALFSVVLIATIAHAGTYLDTAALLLSEARRSNEWVMSHLGDRDLAKAAHEGAEARVRAARQISVPKEVVTMHPHLLLALENSERALDAASTGANEKFLSFLRVSRDEEGTFKSLLSQAKLDLPKVAARPRRVLPHEAALY